MAKMVRMAAMAQHLGITSQELRRVVAEVNFGVKPTDREVPETIAPGIVRFAATKLKIKCPPFMPQKEEEEEETPEEEEIQPEKSSVLNQLKNIAEKSKTDQERKKQEEEQKAQEQTKEVKKTAILRKIEISPEAAAKAKKKMEEDELRRAKEDREEEARERKLMQKKKQDQIFKKKEGVVEIPEQLSVKEFSEKIGVPTAQVLPALIRNGVIATINTTIDYDTAAIIAEELEVQTKKGLAEVSSENLFSGNLSELLKDEKENLEERPPVIVVMGHVDHGKTSILDSIRKAKVAAGEAGGITQHIGAYQVEKNDRLITFLDTPGHESFTSMRARGAKTADIAILVVAADEGIKPQTIEAINHAKAAEVPIIVAMNKMDKQNINPDRVKGELSEHDLQPEEWGGQTPVVPVSAYTGKGIEDLLEIVLLQADLLELKANPNRPAVGTVVEAHLDPSMGPVATILVNTGTLKITDAILVGTTGGKIKAMQDDTGKKLSAVSPSGAVQISGLNDVPLPGDILQVFKTEKEMKESLAEIQELKQERKGSGIGVSEIMERIKTGEMKLLNIVLKADTNGSLEAVKQALLKITHDEVGVKIIHAAVGAVTETDVMMAAASQAIVVGFGVLVSPRCRRIAEKESVEVQNYDIIYNLVEDIEKLLTGLLEPEEVEVVLGTAVAKQIFYTKRKMMIVGCKVESGKMVQKIAVRIYRGEQKIGDGVIATLQHFEKKVPEVEEGQECGIQFEGDIAIEEGDRIEAYQTEKRIRTL